MLNFYYEKVIFIVFYIKDMNKSVPYYQKLKPVFFRNFIY